MAFFAKVFEFDLDLWSFIKRKIKDHRSRSWSHSKISGQDQKIKDHQWWSRSRSRSWSRSIEIFSWDQGRDLLQLCKAPVYILWRYKVIVETLPQSVSQVTLSTAPPRVHYQYILPSKFVWTNLVKAEYCNATWTKIFLLLIVGWWSQKPKEYRVERGEYNLDSTSTILSTGLARHLLIANKRTATTLFIRSWS